ncbi:MAG TPA: hypothetical protein DEH78_09830 [Solibacterales bacterium]|nr:hypothetical protein [Bryobacterales bacterium]
MWYAGSWFENLRTGERFEADWTRGLAVTAGVVTRAGRFWAAIRGVGLVEWIPDATWQRWSGAQFPEDEATQVSVGGQSIYLATAHGLHQLSGGQWLAVRDGNHEIDSILALPNDQIVVSTRKSGLLRIGPDGRALEPICPALAGAEPVESLLVDPRGAIWVATSTRVHRVARPGDCPAEPIPAGILGEPNSYSTLVAEASGVVWFVRRNRIARLGADGQWRIQRTEGELPTVRSFAVRSPEEVWCLSLDRSLFRLRRNGDLWRMSAVASPLTTPQTVHADRRGWIWVGGVDGVSVSKGAGDRMSDWLTLNVANGLAAGYLSRHGITEEPGGAVWLAGLHGVTRVQPDERWFAAPAGDAPAILRAPDGAPGMARIYGLRGSPFRPHPFEYRLQPGAESWIPSSDGWVRLPKLRGGEYTIEARYSGEGGGAIARFAFQAPAASFPWGAAGVGLMVSAAAAAAVIFFRGLWWEAMVYRVRKWLFIRRFQKQSSPASAPGRPAEVTHLDRYRLVRPVSRGSFSVVYEAEDLQGATPRVAVKILNGIPGRDGWVRDQFAQEVAALRSLDHPGVVRVLDSWIGAAGEPCLAMPFVEGPTLRECLRNGPLGARRTAPLVAQLGDTLEAIHLRGVVHRDLKPENLVMLDSGTDREHLVLIDFGASGLKGRQGEQASTTTLVGSTQYLAPERLVGHYSPATDLFSLAVIVLEMITGSGLQQFRRPPGEDDFQAELARCLRNSVSGCEQELAAALALALHPVPSRRPPSGRSWGLQVASLLSDQARRSESH